MNPVYPSKNTPTIMIIFGATGDLMERKIIPSILYLFQGDRMPHQFRVVGFARRPFNDRGFRNHITGIVPNSPKEFLELFSYQAGTFENKQSYHELAEKIKNIEREWKEKANILFYLAVPPEQYQPILTNLAVTKLNATESKKNWSRILIEKPIGRNLASAKKIEAILSKCFRDDQIYRIDHYLTKELLEGIIFFRFSNNLFENSWNNKNIEKIEIRLLEALGVEKRGGFYDQTGALRDVGQNHLLEMLALLTMEYPISMDSSELRSRRAQILQTLKPWTQNDIKKYTFRAQHEGFKDIRGVKPNSNTETYYKLKTELTHPSWSRVPIYMEAGKKCAKTVKEIIITFRHPPTCLLCTPEAHVQNRIVFSLEPEGRITIHFWTKKPGYDRVLEDRTLNFFVYKKKSDVPYVEEYSKLILASITGDQTIFVSKKEIEAMWRFVDPITKAWGKNITSLTSYKPNTNGMCIEADRHIKKSDSVTIPRELGLIGLGKMGGNLARHLLKQGWEVVGYNKTKGATQILEREGLVGAYSLELLVNDLSKPRVILLTVPAGEAVDDIIFGAEGLIKYLQRGDIIIDGGNSFYKNTIDRAKKLSRIGITLVDLGISGGPNGALNGACLMIGGTQKLFEKLEPLYQALSDGHSYNFFPGIGAGHFVKMIHNGIEYGMMQAIAEGFSVLKKSHYHLDLQDIACIYNQGSVIESRLIEWLFRALELRGENLRGVSGVVGQTGEGAWTVQTAKAMKIKTIIIEEAVKFRIKSRQNPNFTGKIVSALREQFGGHSVK